MNISIWFWIGLLVVFIVWIAYGLNQKLQISTYVIKSFKIPPEFDGYTLAVLSDLHASIPEDLQTAVETIQPDVILGTGDIFDGVQDSEPTLKLLENLTKTADVYLISGNHEKYRMDWDELKNKIRAKGIRLLEDESVWIQKKNAKIVLSGIDDPGHILRDDAGNRIHVHSEKRKQLLQKSLDRIPVESVFHILMLHRASFFDDLKREDFDLVLSGHLHGGQWRIFGIPIAGPGNDKRIDFFPRYSAGQYHKGITTLIVSRGIGDQMVIPRFYNRPELVKIVLQHCGK